MRSAFYSRKAVGSVHIFAKTNTIKLEEKEDTIVNLKAETQVERDPVHAADFYRKAAGILRILAIMRLIIITARTAALLTCNVQSIIPSDFVTSVRNHEGYFRVIRALRFSNRKAHIQWVRMLEDGALTALARHQTFFQYPKASKKIHHKVPQQLSPCH
jgi:hypothetical protein